MSSKPTADRGQSRPAGYGAVVWTADHSTVLAESKQAIGRATNNVAEYRGLIAGLDDAVKLGATEAAVLMDSSWWWSRCPGGGRSSTRIC